MITNEILKEKYRVQRRLSASCEDIRDYFRKSHESAFALAQKSGIKLKYRRLPNKTVHLSTPTSAVSTADS